MVQLNNTISWQSPIQLNRLNTKLVIVVYILSCSMIGFSIDIIRGMVVDDLSLTMAIKSLILFGRPLYGAHTMMIGGIFVLIFFYLYHNKIIRLGLNTRELLLDTVKNDREKAILADYQQMSTAMGLTCLPSLSVAEHDIVNAFSSGYNEKNSMVVLTRGLIERLTLLEIKAVLTVALYHIKCRDTQLIQAISFVSNGLIIFFDAVYHASLYGKDRNQDPNVLLHYFYRFLIKIRFMLPSITFLYRFILNPNRIHHAHIMATHLLGDSQNLISALIKIHDAHFDDEARVAKAYSEISHDEIRREAYFFDPADFNLAQTFATPFRTQPSIEEQLEKLQTSNSVVAN